MNAIDEVKRRKVDRQSELNPIIPDVDALGTDDFSAGMSMLNQLVQVGIQRKQELESVIQDNRTGEYWIPYAISGSDQEFEEQANYEHFEKKFPWLHKSGQRIGIDLAKAQETQPDLESWLAAVPHEEWNSFMDDMESVRGDWVSFDEDRAQELRMAEEARFMKEDGWPDLVKAMRDSADDAYDAYLLSKVTEELVWEWSNETGHYPEVEGSSAWMNMDEYGKEPETREWFLEHVDEDEAGWQAVKRKGYEDTRDLFVEKLQALAQQDEQVAHVFHQLDDEHLWQLFLKSFPDEPVHSGDPGWYFYRPNFFYGAHNRQEGAEPEEWRPGFKVDPVHAPQRAWEASFLKAMDYLSSQEWYVNAVRNWTRRPPEGHPEFEFESQEDDPGQLRHYIRDLGDQTFVFTFDFGATEEGYSLTCAVPRRLLAGLDDEARADKALEFAKETMLGVARDDWDFCVEVIEEEPENMQEAIEQQPDPDDPETFVRHGGGIREEKIFEDDKIEVFYSNDLHSINWHLRRAGRPEMTAKNFEALRHDDIFIIVGKEPADLLGRDGKRELGIVYGDGVSDLTAWKTTYDDKASLKALLSDPTYGRSVRRMLLRFYKDQGRDDAAPIFLQVGGPRALRRAGARGQIDMNQWSTTLGIHYVKQKKYKLAANAFGRDADTLTPKGVFLRFDNLNELADLFDNSKAANEVFDQEIYYWFDGMPMPDVKDVTEFLTPKAIQHIRSVMINREVWYPDAGPDGQGALVLLTTPLLNEVDDATIIDWLENPNDEDGNVFEDITDAIQHIGFSMVESVGSDEYYTAYIKAALKAFDGTEYKWVNHPIKEGADMFQVFVPWQGIFDAAQKYLDDNSENWSGDLEQLVLKAYHGSVEGPDVQPGIWDVKDALKKSPGWAEDFMYPIYELEPPEQPEVPGQEQLPLGEGLDDPEAMPDLLSGIPPALEAEIRQKAADFAGEQGVQIKDMSFDFGYSDKEYHYLLKVSFKPEGAWIDHEGTFAHPWEVLMNMLTTPINAAYRNRFWVVYSLFSDERPGYVTMVYSLGQTKDPYLPF